MERVATYLDELRELRSIGKVLDDRVAGMKRQLDDMYETVALGLTAESIAHEVFQIADGLARRTKAVEAKLDGSRIDGLSTYLEHVRSSVSGLRKQISYLSPGLR